MSQQTLETTQVVRHLLWHKAIVEHDEDGAAIDQYIQLVTEATEGEHVSMRDPFHRDLAIAFELVTQEHMDPWDLDLQKFSQLYLKEARERGVDLVTAGRILLMAWTVLKLQSDEVADRAVIVEDEEWGWDDIQGFDLTDDEWDYTERIHQLPRAPIDEKIRHKGDRKVTLMELIGAFADIHDEAEQRRVLSEEKAKARASLKRKMRGRVGGMMHKEDLQTEIQETWQRILEQESQPIRFADLVEPDPVDVVQTFNAILFLAKGRRIDVSQEDFPFGEVWITPLLPEGAAEALQEEIPKVKA